jgi:RHS repeat-associated protein
VTVTCVPTADLPLCFISGQNVYFGKKLLVSNGVNVVTDWLGSVRANTQGESMAYYPYGEERTSTVDGREKFGTYFRDMVGQDYADQRYCGSGTGRFWTADPGGIGTASPTRPSSWNRYAYVEGDPVNSTDRRGLYMCVGCGDDEEPDDPCDDNSTMIGCGGGGAAYGYRPVPPTVNPTGGGSGQIAVPSKAPPCAQNQGLAAQALGNIVGAVGQVLTNSGLFTQGTIGTIENDLSGNENDAADVGFVGGHFNVVLTTDQINSLGTFVAGEVNGLFLGGTDGSASGILGLIANGPRHDLPNGTSLHSQMGGNGIDFHIDLGNPYRDIAGIVRHVGKDILPRNKCLDAPFTASTQGSLQ